MKFALVGMPSPQAAPVEPAVSAKVASVGGEWETWDLVMDRSARKWGAVLDL